MTKPDPVWVITDGAAGMEAQALGLAEGLGLPFTIKRVKQRPPYHWLPWRLWRRPLETLAADSDPLDPPWPRLVIATGRRAMPYAVFLRRLSKGATRAVYIQNPRIDSFNFDLVIAPEHDGIEGPNVIRTLGALNRVTPQRLAEAAATEAPALEGLPRPYVMVVLGGNSKTHSMTAGATKDLTAQLRALSDTGASLLVTTSRRTPPEAVLILREALKGLPHRLYDQSGPNPYFGWLGLADAIVVTSDSVNMVTEAASTGKPVMVAALPGGSPKFTRFHAAMEARGITRPFHGKLENWSYTPLAEMPRAVTAVEALLAHK